MISWKIYLLFHKKSVSLIDFITFKLASNIATNCAESSCWPQLSKDWNLLANFFFRQKKRKKLCQTFSKKNRERKWINFTELFFGYFPFSESIFMENIHKNFVKLIWFHEGFLGGWTFYNFLANCDSYQFFLTFKLLLREIELCF